MNRIIRTVSVVAITLFVAQASMAFAGDKNSNGRKNGNGGQSFCNPSSSNCSNPSKTCHPCKPTHHCYPYSTYHTYPVVCSYSVSYILCEPREQVFTGPNAGQEAGVFQSRLASLGFQVQLLNGNGAIRLVFRAPNLQVKFVGSSLDQARALQSFLVSLGATANITH